MSPTMWRTSLIIALQAFTLGFTSQELWQAWPDERWVEVPAPCLRHPDLAKSLHSLAASWPHRVALAEIGRSFQNRPIYLLTLGQGAKKVLLWSQMHGDEPSATPALLDVAGFLLSRAEEPTVAAILEGATLLMIPMLNPDGAELYLRRNAQGIDINRDALNLATPEGRILKRIRDEHEPILGFNLHDQNRRTTVGDTGRLATTAVLAVAGDAKGTLTPGRLRAKRACAAVVEALSPLMPGGMARYDEDWSPRAFGDNLTAWGTPVVLIESGGLPPGQDLTELTRLNFVAILAVLQDLVGDDFAGHDPATYDALLRNDPRSWSDVVVRNGFLLQPGSGVSYRADLSFDLLTSDRLAAGCAVDDRPSSQIFEVGDSRFISAGRTIDATDSLILAPFVVGVRGWAARKWLDADLLSRMGSMGVETVSWQVKKRRLAAATAAARALAGRDRARLEVTASPAAPPASLLTGPPPTPASHSLAAILEALAQSPRNLGPDGPSPVDRLLPLWPVKGRDGAVAPKIRPGQPASFLLVHPAPEGQIDPDKTELTAVWIDGLEIRVTP